MLGGRRSLCILSLRSGVGVDACDLTGGSRVRRRPRVRAFFVSHYGRLYALGVLLTGDRGQAEELAQDALVRTYRRWALVGPPDDPASFARRVLINRHRSLLRRGVVEARQTMVAKDHNTAWPIPQE
jgi:DNA-directed RNA polymerase specialized sigma24 family protein